MSSGYYVRAAHTVLRRLAEVLELHLVPLQAAVACRRRSSASTTATRIHQSTLFGFDHMWIDMFAHGADALWPSTATKVKKEALPVACH